MSMQDISPAEAAVAVTPNDGTDILETKGLYVGVAGDVKVTMHRGTVVTLVGLVAGVVHPIRVRRVWSTDTTATDIIAFY
jgi:sporulation protein YlmC with PRC-barrel domain